MAVCRLHLQITLAAIFFQGFSWFLLSSLHYDISSGTGYVLSCAVLVFGILSMVVSLAYFWALSQWSSPNLTFLQLTCILLVRVIERVFARLTIRRIQASWKAPRQAQERLLQDIIKENGNTEYGRRYDLKTVRSLKEFRERHPLTTYEHYRAYVDRMMEGEENVLTKKKPTSYVRTTGTTGKSKYIPYTSKMRYLGQFSQCMKSFITKDFPSVDGLHRMVYFYVHPIVTKAKSGASIETIGTLPANLPQMFLYEIATPTAGLQIQSSFESCYIHFLFGLRETDVVYLNIGFLSFLERAFNQLKGYWRDIVRDVQTGTIKPDIKLPDDVRRKLTAALGKGDPERACQLRQEFEKGFDGIMKRVWPRLTVITAIDNTGLWPKFERTFGKGVALMQAGYGSSEGFFAANLGRELKDPRAVGYVPFPCVTILEFIKLSDIYQIQPKTYFVDEVEVGQCYEVVLTQGASGLYRYRLGDVVKVTGFHDNCPVIEFSFRIGQILNLRYEKLDQRVVEEAIHASVAQWSGRSLVEFTVAESTLIPEDSQAQFIEGDAPGYVFFIELNGDDGAPVTLSDDEKLMVDEELRSRNADYNRLRREGSICRPRVIAVRAGAFEALRTYILENTNATAMQYKSPRKLRMFEMFQVMADLAL